MGWFKQESLYEKRMRELEEEAERLRRNMQSLMKTARRDAADPRPDPMTTPSGMPRYRTPPPPPAPEPEVDGMFDDTADADDDMGVETPPSKTTRGSSTSALPPYGPPRMRPVPGGQSEKLSSYLASGSFGKKGSLTREKRIQRNKAIFMAIFALLAVFSLISWLK